MPPRTAAPTSSPKIAPSTGGATVPEPVKNPKAWIEEVFGTQEDEGPVDPPTVGSMSVEDWASACDRVSFEGSPGLKSFIRPYIRGELPEHLEKRTELELGRPIGWTRVTRIGDGLRTRQFLGQGGVAFILGSKDPSRN